MRRLPLKAQIYIYALLVVVALLVAFSCYTLRLTPLLALEIVIFSLAICIADYYPIELPQGNKLEVTVSCVLKTAAAIIFGPQVAILTAMLGTALGEAVRRRRWFGAAFNTAEMTVTFAIMAYAYEGIQDGARMPFHSLQNAAGVLCMLLLYYLVNTGLVAIIVTLDAGISFWRIWRDNFRDMVWNDLTIIPLGAVMAELWLHQPWSTLVLVLPVAVVRQSFQFISALRQQTRQALFSMADAIDRRDPSTFEHSQRVATLAEAIAVDMNLGTDDVEMIHMAARLHDLGKIGMSNALLNKPGRFDEEEWTTFRRHPDIGADMVKSFRLFSEGQELIRHHHEHYDGHGYPLGINGAAIPQGSRILAVADSLDAMTSRRIYQKALTVEDAVVELLRNKGTQFDPEVVDACLRVLKKWGDKLPWVKEEAPSRSITLTVVETSPVAEEQVSLPEERR
jgi:putative nucleotidyltransferase with HDIG domain